MKNLQPFKEPPPPEKQACRACKTFVPELLVPMGDEAVPMCWLCAHHVVEHEASMQAAPSACCECSHNEIFPAGHPRYRGALATVATVREDGPWRQPAKRPQT